MIEPTLTVEGACPQPPVVEGNKVLGSTYQAALSLTAGEEGLCLRVNTYVLQLRKQDPVPMKTGRSST